MSAGKLMVARTEASSADVGFSFRFAALVTLANSLAESIHFTTIHHNGEVPGTQPLSYIMQLQDISSIRFSSGQRPCAVRNPSSAS